ncbi:MAG: glycosyltransferase family 2 protein [Candidatus Shapirobacteria bacterium]|nr:glycosyltransferase family 2 protein [Candidatus Shapirobacteria bacterium]
MTKKDPSFSIIIPNYNGAQFLDDCLYSLYQSIKQCSSHFEIIIIDNASKDNSLNLIKNFFNQYKSTKMSAKINQLNGNLGFASAVNIGINQAKYKYIVVCNNDLTLEKNWFQLISNTIAHNKNPKITTFFGTVLNKNGTKFESQGLKFFINGKAKNISNGKPFNKSLLPKSNKLIWGASAALVVYQKNIIQKIGLFDNDFFAYEEDVDISLRLAKLNYKTFYIPPAICYHLGGGTSNKMGNFRNRMDAKNWLYIIIKNYSAKEFWINLPSIFTERLRNLFSLIKITIKNYKLMSIYYLPIDIIKTYGEVLIKLPKMIKKRKQIQKLVKSIKL